MPNLPRPLLRQRAGRWPVLALPKQMALLSESGDMRNEVLLPKGYGMTITPQPWISVSERLPDRNEIVLATDQDGVTVGSYSPMLDDWWTLHGDRMAPGAVVTNWMPLPKPPTE